ELGPDDWRTIVQMTLAASLVVSGLALLQVADVPLVRAFIERFYPGTGEAAQICSQGPCRATSLLEHWSGLGAYAVLHYTLALALCVYNRAAMAARWLVPVMAVNAMAAFVSGTQA